MCCHLLWLALAAAITGCDRNDLSDINSLYQARLDAETGDVKFNATLTPEQVVASEIPSSDRQADANFIFDHVTGSLSGDVEFTSPQTMSVQAVEIYQGRGGHVGRQPVATLIPDPAVSGRYQLTDNYAFDQDQLLDGNYYVLARTDQHISGELRAQLLPEWKQLLVHTLTPEQVVDGPVTTDATARSFMTVDLLDNTLKGSVWYSSDIAPANISISMYTELAGKTGERVFQFDPDPEKSGIWNVPDGQVLTESLWQRLEAAELYIQITSTTYPDGELRTQIYYPYFRVWTVDLSAHALGSPAPMGAAGKAYVTVEGGEVVNGNIRAIVRITGMAADKVSLVRVNNTSNPNSRQLVFSLDPVDDYWRLPAEALLENKDFNAIGNGKLYFVATPADPMAGEIAGML
ncbi:MAG: CHRD domain-containing protein [Gammaproteobacteria bacterium]